MRHLSNRFWIGWERLLIWLLNQTSTGRTILYNEYASGYNDSSREHAEEFRP